MTMWEGNGKTASVISQCAWQDGLALLVQKEGLYHFLPETEAMNKILDWDSVQGIEWLAGDQTRLWGYSGTASTLRLLMPQAGESEAVLRLLDHPVDESQGYASQAEQLFITGQYLYALFRPPAFNGYKTSLAAWQLADGKRVDVHQPEHLQAVSSYKGGRLIGLVMDAWTAANTPDDTARKPSLVVFDPKSGLEEELGILNEPVLENALAFAWEERDDGIYYNSGNKLFYRNSHGQEILYSYLGNDLFFEGVGNRLVPLPNQTCAVLDLHTRAILYSAIQDHQQQALVIFGLMTRDRAHFDALDQIRGTGVDYLDRNWDDDSFLPQLLQNGSVDLIFLQSTRDEVARMIDKGYLMDLRFSPVLSEHLGRCYPFLQKEAKREEGFFLLPVSMDAMVHLAKPAMFDALGLAIPETFDELCAFLETWNRDYAEEHSSILPYYTGNPENAMMDQARALGLFTQVFREEVLQFDTHLVRGLLTRAFALELDQLVKEPDDTSWYHQKHLMVYQNYSLTSLTMSAMDDPLERTIPLIIKPSSGEIGVLPCQVVYLAISASTKNPEAALMYAEQYVSSLHASTYIQLYPDENSPIETPGIGEHIDSLQAEEQSLLEQTKSAEGARLGELNERLAGLKQQIAGQEAMRYLVSPEVIAQYRLDMKTAFVLNRDLDRLINGKEFTQLYERWKQGQISLDGLLSESDSKLRLMRLEDD